MRPKRIVADLGVFTKSYIRNPVALFFSLIFPLILIGTFGYIFSGPVNPVTLYTENLDHGSAVSQAFLDNLTGTGAVRVSVVDPSAVNGTSGGFPSWLANNGDTVGLVIPKGFQAAYEAGNSTVVTLYTDPQDQASAGIALGAVEGVSNGFNLAAAHGRPIVTAATATVGSQVFKYIDFLVPGLIGFTILVSPMFAMVDIASSYRKEHIFRQLSLTPLTKGEWLAAKIAWYVLLTFVNAAIMLAFATVVFGAHVVLTLGLVPFLVLGPFLFVSLGMLAGSVAKTPESAALAANVITFPMMFLSGTFFPVSMFSPPLMAVAHILPLSYVIDGMTQVMLFQHYGTQLWIDFGVTLVGSVVVFGLAVVAFKWRDE